MHMRILIFTESVSISESSAPYRLYSQILYIRLEFENPFSGFHNENTDPRILLKSSLLEQDQWWTERQM